MTEENRELENDPAETSIHLKKKDYKFCGLCTCFWKKEKNLKKQENVEKIPSDDFEKNKNDLTVEKLD